MKMNGHVINKDEIIRIHNDSARVLEEIGVKIPSEKVLAMLEKAGAKVNYNTHIALLSRAMVENAIKSAPKEFTLGARNPEFDLVLPSATPKLTMDGCGSYVFDMKTGKRQLATLADLANAGRVFEVIEDASVLWSCVLPSDIAASSSNFVCSAVSMINCSKHLQDEVQTIEEVPYYVEL